VAPSTPNTGKRFHPYSQLPSGTPSQNQSPWQEPSELPNLPESITTGVQLPDPRDLLEELSPAPLEFPPDNPPKSPSVPTPTPDTYPDTQETLDQATARLANMSINKDDGKDLLSLLNKPTRYNGDPKNFDSFLNAIMIYMHMSEKFKDDKAKIILVLTHLTEGQAKDWADLYMHNALKDEKGEYRSTPIWGTWEEFRKAFTATFKDPHVREKAQRKLHTMRPGPQESVEEFFRRFENQRLQAGYIGEAYNANLITILNDVLPNDVTIEIVKMDGNEAVKKYEGYRAKAISIDNLIAPHRRGAAPRPSFIHPRPNPRFLPAHPAPAPPRPPPPRPQFAPQSWPRMVRPPTGNTYGGMGEPMELDRSKGKRACFSCGSTDHLLAQCPQRARHVRAFWADLSPGERNDLASVVYDAPKDDFEEGKEEEWTNVEGNVDDVVDEDFTQTQQ
jgi:hypothetical protein